MALTTILGAGGPISNELAKILIANGTPLRLVSRNPKAQAGAEIVAADITDLQQAIKAVAGSSVVHLLVGLKYDLRIWQEVWPRIMANTIEATKRAGAKLLFFDNVYMYGKVDGPMTEQTAYAPVSKKGAIRAQIATTLMDEVKRGRLTAMIARAADFYGPADAQHGMPNVLVFDAWTKGSKAAWMINDSVPHSLTYTPDAARGVALLAERDSAWNQIWHLPTAAPAPTGKEFIAMAAQAFAVKPRHRILNRGMIKVGGWFNPMVRELYEMLYQYDSPYLFDSSKFAREFGFGGTPYGEGIRAAARSFGK
jgi:nucleoside-diphosphate-sugar epimerase